MESSPYFHLLVNLEIEKQESFWRGVESTKAVEVEVVFESCFQKLFSVFGKLKIEETFLSGGWTFLSGGCFLCFTFLGYFALSAF